MSLTWLGVGALVGAIGGLRSGSVIELVSGLLGGMVVLPIAGAFLGLIGGDPVGSMVGALGGLLGCWLSLPVNGIAVDTPITRFVVLFASLAGATVFLYVRLKFWIYEKFCLIAWKVIRASTAQVGVSCLPVLSAPMRRTISFSARFHAASSLSSDPPAAAR
jgi:hypothetical protein